MDVSRELILLFLCLVVSNGEEIFGPVVQIRNGKIRGRDHGHYISFESIPYAQPPIGELRFEPPQPISQKWTNCLDASKPPIKCIQWDQYLFREDLLVGIEDCLIVNVYTPSITGNRTYPVLVLIHGGAFMFGAAVSNGHDYIMNEGNTVVVKMNYRLGPLGFLSTADEAISGNFGLKDQLLALEWVKDNVASFNGNTANITILGFSSGGAAVHLQMLNKRLEKLATSAISFSGTAFCPWAITRNPLKRATDLAEYLNCSSSAIKSCLQQKKAEDIVRAVKYFQKFGYNPFTVFGPVIESAAVSSAFLTEEPEVIVKNGKSAAIPFLVTYSKDDGGYNAAELFQKDESGKELIYQLNERWNELAPVNLFYKDIVEKDKLDSYSNGLKAKYMGSNVFSVENYRLLQKMYTDILFVEGVEKALRLHKDYTQAPVYSYVYDNPAAYGIGQILSHRENFDFGTVHGDDFFLIFKSEGKSSDIRSQSDRILSTNFINMVIDFSTHGTLQFGSCKFIRNNPLTKGLIITHIFGDTCHTENVDTLVTIQYRI